MALAVKREERYTAKEYLALEEAADSKSEYHNGTIYTMAGGSLIMT